MLTTEIDRIVSLYKLLSSGNYVYDNTVSLIDFIRILRLVKMNRNFHKCFKKSHLELISFIGIIELLKNVSIIELTKSKKIKILNTEIFEILYANPSKIRIILKLIRKIPIQKYLFRKLALKSKVTLIGLYQPNFKLNPRSFQFPCSLSSSFKRVILICQKIYHQSQKAIFIGDDDLISILCKFIIPELSITVIEIDGRITKLLKDIAKKHKFDNFNVYNLDFKEFNEIKRYLNKVFSIIHLDPPYDAKELKQFLSNLSLIQDNSLVQIFLNGLFNTKCIPIINEYVAKNKLMISDYFKSFNSYSFQTTNHKHLKIVKKQLKRETDLKFKKKDIEKIEFFSDMYILERSLTEQEIDLEKEVD